MRKTKKILLFVLLVSICHVVPALEVSGLKLSGGRSDQNRIGSPVLDATGLGNLSFGDFVFDHEPDRYIVYMLNKTLFTESPKYKKPHYKLAASEDLGALLGEAFRSEAEAMGFNVASGAENAGGWRISGQIHDFATEIRMTGGGFGATMFYGYMDLDLMIDDASGTRQSERIKLYNMSQFYNAGFGLQDEIKQAMERFIVESAQEAVAHLNRAIFAAPPHPGMTARLQALGSVNEDTLANELQLVGLSGDEKAVPTLLTMLDLEKDENSRVHIINSLANLGSEEALDALSSRYAKEDEDCRLFILKATEYIGTTRAQAFTRQAGTDDDDIACRRLAQRASGWS